MANIKSITLQFENCEIVNFPTNVFGTFYIGHTHTYIKRTAMNEISKINHADEVVMEMFFPEAEQQAIKELFFGDNCQTVFARLCHYRDITHIAITYDDDTEEIYETDYEDEVEGQLGSNNKNQKFYVSECGNLYIVIGYNRNISDYFDKDYINNSKYVEFRKDWYI